MAFRAGRVSRGNPRGWRCKARRSAMKSGTLRIDRLVFKLPHASAQKPQQLASTIAEKLGEALKQGRLKAADESIPQVQVTVPRQQAHGPGIAKAIESSLARGSR